MYKGNHNLKGSWVSNGLNQYSSINGVTHNYDDNGNLTGDGSTTYVYDAENRLTSATGAKNLTLTYDPLGRLHTTTNEANTTTTYLYSGDALIAEYVGSTMTKRYVHGNGIDNPLVEYHGSTIGSANRYYLHSDHQGSITGISNSTGTVTALNTYDSFGIPHQTNQGRFSYTGQIYLPELEMYHYKARVYDPKLGRFLQTDPVGYAADMNMYAYTMNDPLNYTDPSGEIPLVVVAIWILKEVGGEVFEQTTGIPAPTAKNIAKFGMRKAMRLTARNRNKISGTYDFKEGDKDYVGQSEDVMKRIQQHATKGRFTEDKAGTLKTTKVLGDKRDREFAEQTKIDTITDGFGAKSDLVSNKINPVKRGDNGMSGSVVKICSGTGAQKDSCD